MISEIHRLLDQHLAALEQLGSPVGAVLSPPPVEDAVRTTLRAAGYHDRDDVVALYTWRGYLSVDDQRGTGPHFFDATCYLAPCESGIRQHDAYTQIRDETLGGDLPADELVHLFPGLSHYIPVAFTGSADWISVDCRPDPIGGSVLRSVMSEDATSLFGSLSDAIAAATYCVETGIWQLTQQGEIISSDNPK